MKPFNSMITFCYTENMDESHVFYTEVLRLPMVLDQGGCRIYRIAEEAFIGFCSRRENNQREGVTITLVTDDVDEWFERVENAGYEVIRKPAPTPEYGIYNCFVRDPSGYTVEIQRFEDPQWQKRK